MNAASSSHPSSSVEQLARERMRVVMSEIRSFSARIDHLVSRQDELHYGYDHSCSTDTRLFFLRKATRSGKQLSKSSILLVMGVLEILRNGAHGEKELKEALVLKFKDSGMKVSSRSVFAGTSLEVSSVCNILCALGVLEVGSSSVGAALSPADSNLETFEQSFSSLFEVIKHRFDTSPMEPMHRIEPSVGDNKMDVEHSPGSGQVIGGEALLSAGDGSLKLNVEALDVDDIGGASGQPTPHNPDEDMELVDLLMGTSGDDRDHAVQPIMDILGDRVSSFSNVDAERSFSLPSEQQLLGAFDSVDHLDADVIGGIPAIGAADSNVFAGDSEPGRKTGSMSGSSRKQSHGSGKVWSLRNPNQFPFPLVSLILAASAQFSKWVNSNYQHAVSLEIEEKLLRRVAGQCGVYLPNAPIRVGTAYLDHKTPIGQGAPAEVETFDNWSGPQTGAVVDHLSRRDLLDPTLKFTSDSLIEKVEKSRRQAGESLPSNSGRFRLFSSSHLHTLRQVCKRTHASLRSQYAGSAMGGADSLSSAKSMKRMKSGFGDQVSLAEFIARPSSSGSAPQHSSSGLSGSTAASGSSQNFSAISSSLASIALGGSYPSVTPATIKRYALPHQTWTDHIFDRSYVGVPSYSEMPMMNRAILIPDLAITTLEIPWKTLTPEFTLISLDEAAGEFVDGLSTVLLSHAEQSVDNSSSQQPPSEQSPQSSKLQRKRTRSVEKGLDELQGDHNLSVHHSLKRKIISDVHAPRFREMETSRNAPVVAEGDEEDSSDEHYLQAHDHVLQAMREKWALMGKLKQEVRRESTSSGPVTAGRGRVVPAPFSTATTATTEYTFGGNGFYGGAQDQSAAKKRGRPPKHHKQAPPGALASRATTS